MFDLQVYASGLRDGEYTLRLCHALETCAGVRYKVDRDHDMVYFEFDEPTMSLTQVQRLFEGVGLQARFVGFIPPELQEPSTKTEKLSL